MIGYSIATFSIATIPIDDRPKKVSALFRIFPNINAKTGIKSAIQVANIRVRPNE